MVLCLSVIISCLPYLKPFLESLSSGILGTDYYEGSQIGQSTVRPKPYGSENSMLILQHLNSRSKVSTKVSSGNNYGILQDEIPSLRPADNMLQPGRSRSAASIESSTSRTKMIKVTTSVDWEAQNDANRES
jgi:hypothetical protein